jgi:hypothetical protein
MPADFIDILFMACSSVRVFRRPLSRGIRIRPVANLAGSNAHQMNFVSYYFGRIRRAYTISHV